MGVHPRSCLKLHAVRGAGGRVSPSTSMEAPGRQGALRPEREAQRGSGPAGGAGARRRGGRPAGGALAAAEARRAAAARRCAGSRAWGSGSGGGGGAREGGAAAGGGSGGPGRAGARQPSAQAAARGARHAGAGLRLGEAGPRRAAAAPAGLPAAARPGPRSGGLGLRRSPEMSGRIEKAGEARRAGGRERRACSGAVASEAAQAAPRALQGARPAAGSGRGGPGGSGTRPRGRGSGSACRSASAGLADQGREPGRARAPAACPGAATPGGVGAEPDTMCHPDEPGSLQPDASAAVASKDACGGACLSGLGRGVRVPMPPGPRGCGRRPGVGQWCSAPASSLCAPGAPSGLPPGARCSGRGLSEEPGEARGSRASGTLAGRAFGARAGWAAQGSGVSGTARPDSPGD